MSKLRENKRILVLISILLICGAVVAASAAAVGQPVSDTDPLVTKSYVDQQIAKILAQGGTSGGTGATVDSAAVEQLRTDVGELTKFIIDSLTQIEALKNRVAALEAGFTVVQVKKNQTLLLAGGSEALIRSGKATALKGQNGVLVDVSAGIDLNHGVNVPVQHLLISASADGRGLLVTGDAYILVRGGYTIK